ncbi:hypothetical protein EVAR_62250_1 [Eumeta japonica]|uniref:Uncharacterized protein n=1 Tax=Eumeta variegata TaxID=151549 RepID=A0A4C1ZDV5_EUMVA|nr:hypothetical protein EVAR_62250_1 [Eumeta japonica]
MFILNARCRNFEYCNIAHKEIQKIRDHKQRSRKHGIRADRRRFRAVSGPSNRRHKDTVHDDLPSVFRFHVACAPHKYAAHGQMFAGDSARGC